MTLSERLILAGAKTCILVMSSEVETSLNISVEATPSKTETARDSSTSVGMTKMTEKIIVALDVPSKGAALRLVEQLRPEISFFKIGLQLYIAEGPEIVRLALATGAKVFLDLKLHDIPNTVAKAVESVSELGVQMLTIHLIGGAGIIRAAVAARKGNMSILGVTVLTSATDKTLPEVGISDKLDDQVLRL